MATYRFVIADGFTDTPLQGDQLAVFTDAREIPEDLLQPFANEIGFSETVFVYPSSWDFATRRQPQGETASESTGDRQENDETVCVYPAEGEGHARIRTFTPVSELPFARH